MNTIQKPSLPFLLFLTVFMVGLIGGGYLLLTETTLKNHEEPFAAKFYAPSLPKAQEEELALVEEELQIDEEKLSTPEEETEDLEEEGVPVPEPLFDEEDTPLLPAPLMDGSLHVLFGQDLDSEGVILDPETSFDDTEKPIHLNLYLNNEKQQTITIDLYYLDKEHGEEVRSFPLIETLDAVGQAMFSFSFYPPEGGWPKGIYSFKISLEDRPEQRYSFEMR